VNTKYIRLALVIIGFGLCIVCKAQLDEGMVRTNPSWHIISHYPDSTVINQLTRSLPSNSVIRFMPLTNGQYAWTTNMEQFWHGNWLEDTNGFRVQLNTASNASSFMVSVQVGTFRLGLPPGSIYYATPNGKFAKFKLTDSNGLVIPPKPGAGTNLLDTIRVYYRTNPPAWAAPSAGSLVADFPERVSTNVWPLYYKGVGLARSVHMTARGYPRQISSLNLYDLYFITKQGDYTLTVQPVLYMQKSYASEFLDRMDLPSVTTNVHLVPNPQ
jgi:hypothetical protein